MRLTFSVLTVGLALTAIGCQEGVTSLGLMRSPASHTGQTLGDTYDHLLYLPEGHVQGKQWPLMIFLHGSGERGADLEMVKKHGPPKRVGQNQALPFVIISPQCPTGQSWSAHKVMRLIDHAVQTYKIDPKRIYLTGLSMGGYGTWSTAIEYPERFAAIAPICGGGDPKRADRLKSTPTWAIHGEKDKAVPVEKSIAMIDAMREAGAVEARLTLHPDAGHDSWTRTYDDPAFYDWLLKHTRN